MAVSFSARAANIGPDDFGYVATDTVPYAFEDISGTGTGILAGQDDFSVAVPVGFSFNFYGVGYTTVGVSVNGLLTFGGLNSAFVNGDLTIDVPSGDNPSLAVLWEDWFAAPGQVYYQTLGSPGTRRFIVQWNQVRRFGLSDAQNATFQAVLYEANGAVKLQYADTDVGNATYDFGASATVGVRDRAGQANGRVLQWSFNSAVIPNNLALEFRPTRQIGPDNYGYTGRDVGPYAFEDISLTGTAILAGLDDSSLAVPVGFSFNFYGVDYTTVGVSVNGLLSFGGLNSQFENQNLLTAAPASDLPSVAVYWDDLYTQPGEIYYQTLGSPGSRRLVVQWNQVRHFSTPSSQNFTFQAVLYEANQSIKVQFADLDVQNDGLNLGASATVGVRDRAGQLNGRALQWSFNWPILANGQAIVFSPWGTGKVAVFGVPGDPAWNTDVRNKIANRMPNIPVDAFLAGAGQPVPTLLQLMAYKSVIVYSDAPFNDPVAMGDVLADYVDAGGGVVLATFALDDGSWAIRGRLVTGGYLPFTQAATISGTPLNLVADIPGHLLLNGVAGFNGGSSSYHSSGITTTAGAVLVAHWSDGQPLVGVKAPTQGRVVAFNFYPPSSDARADFWDATTGGGLLMANALKWAGAPTSKVAVFGAPSTDAWNDDVRNKIANRILNVQVDNFLVGSGSPVPTLARLLNYKSVLVYSDSDFGDPVALGNVLADYVDSGGGVVLATFGFYSSGPLGIQGRLASGGYLPLTLGGQTSGTQYALIPDQPGHPILRGVVSFDGGTSSYHNSPISTAPGALLIAHWTDGQPLVAAKEVSQGRVVGLNFYPPSSDARADFWNAATDGGLLMANALNWAGAPAITILNAANTGWYDSSGFHGAGNANYLCGENTSGSLFYRDFFVFNVPAFTRPVLDAELRLNAYTVVSPTGVEPFELHEVTTPIATLIANASGAVATYDDLGDGPVFGRRGAYVDQSGTFITVPLNSTFVSAVSAARGSAIALGGLMTSLVAGGNDEFAFGYSFGNAGDVQLILWFVPHLHIDQAGNQVQISWADTPDNWLLQSCRDLTNPLWIDVPDPAVIISGQKVVVIPATGGASFFRLRLAAWK